MTVAFHMHWSSVKIEYIPKIKNELECLRGTTIHKKMVHNSDIRSSTLEILLLQMW